MLDQQLFKRLRFLRDADQPAGWEYIKPEGYSFEYRRSFQQKVSEDECIQNWWYYWRVTGVKDLSRCDQGWDKILGSWKQEDKVWNLWENLIVHEWALTLGYFHLKGDKMERSIICWMNNWFTD